MAYAGGPLRAVSDYLAPASLAFGTTAWIGGPALLTVGWAVARPHRAVTSRWCLWTAWAVGAMLTTALPGHLFPHYYQYALPVGCVGGGWAAAGLMGRPGRRPPVGRAVFVAAALSCTVAHEVPYYRLSPEQWCWAKRAGDYVEQRQLAERMAELLRPGERFWDDGEDNTLYFAAAQSPISGLLYPDPMEDGPADRVRQLRDRLLSEVTTARPELVVVWRLRHPHSMMPDPRLASWLARQYVEVKGVAPEFLDYLLAVRRDSDLYRRLTQGRPWTATQPVSLDAM